MTRRTKLFTGVGAGAAIAIAGIAGLLSNAPARANGASAVGATDEAGLRGNGAVITVYRTPTCGCCRAWEDHMRENGFSVESVEMTSLDAVKAEHGVPRPLQSCHTGVVEGFVVEGHVPADEVARMLRDRPDIQGLAVPGMPTGSPGMEVPGRRAQPYEVFAFTESGAAEVWATR